MPREPVIAVRSDAADDEVTAAAHPDDMATCLGMHHMTRPAEVPRGESSALTETDPTALLIWCSHRGSRQAPLIPMTSCQAMSTGASARRRPTRVVVEPLVERVFGPSQPELHPPPLMVSPLLVGFGSLQGQTAAEKLSTMCLNWTLSFGLR